MQKQEEYLSTKENIIKITKDLKSHYKQGEFLDLDKNFNTLLANIITLFDKDDLITDLITNEEMYYRFKQKYEDAAEYIKLLESNKLDNRITFDKFNYKSPTINDNNELNKSMISAVPLDAMSQNGEHFYISDSPDLSLRNKLRKFSLIKNKAFRKEENSNSLEDNNKNTFIFGMEPEKLKEEYIKIFEEKKQIEHDYLITLEKLTKLENTEKAHQDILHQYEGLIEKTKQMNEEILNAKERIKQIGQENIELINLNNQYIEAIETIHCETGNAKSRVINENTKLRKLEKDMAKSKKKINDLENIIEKSDQRIIKEREERVFIQKQYEDYIYNQENALANLKIESEKVLRENLIEKLIEMNQNSNSLIFFYNEETNKIEIFFEDEKIFDMQNLNPADKREESLNNSKNGNIQEIKLNENNNLQENLKLRIKSYSFDGKLNNQKALLFDLSSASFESDKEENEIENLENNITLNKNKIKEIENDPIQNNPIPILANDLLLNTSETVLKAKKKSLNKKDLNEERSIIDNNNAFKLLHETNIPQTANEINFLYNQENLHENNSACTINEKKGLNQDLSKKNSLNSVVRRRNENYYKRRVKNSKSISFGNNNHNEMKRFFSENITDYKQNNYDANTKTSYDLNNNTPKLIKSSSINKGNDENFIKNSVRKLNKRDSLAFNSLNRSEKLLFNVKNRLFNSDQVQKFVLENLNVDENFDYQAKEIEYYNDNNQNKPSEFNFNNENNLDNPLFKSTNSSFIHDTSFNSKAVRRTTINNFNVISNKLSSIANGENNFINENAIQKFENKYEEVKENHNTSRNESLDLHNDSYQNIKPNNFLPSEKNFILEDLIEEDRLITERNNDEAHRKSRASSLNNSRSFNIFNESSEDQNIHEVFRKNLKQVNLIVDQIEIDDNDDDINQNNILIQENRKDSIIKEKDKIEKNVVNLNKALDYRNNIKKPFKKLHRKSLSNFNPSTIDIESLTRDKKESSKYNINLDNYKPLNELKLNLDNNSKRTNIYKTIIENDDLSHISNNEKNLNHEIKDTNRKINDYLEKIPRNNLTEKNKVADKDDKNEVEKCIKSIDINTLFKGVKNENLPNNLNRTFKKSFDNSNFKKKIQDDFKLPNRNKIRDRIFSTKITSNNHYSKYTLNLAPSQESSFINNNHNFCKNHKPNDDIKTYNPHDKINMKFNKNFEKKFYNPQHIKDYNEIIDDDYSNKINDLNKSSSSYNKINAGVKKDIKNKSYKTINLQELLNKIPEKKKSFYLIENNNNYNVSSIINKAFTGICFDSQINNFCILSNNKKREKLQKRFDYNKTNNSNINNNNKDYLIKFYNNETENLYNSNPSLESSGDISSHNYKEDNNQNYQENDDLNNACIQNRGYSKSFHQKGRKEVDLLDNKDLGIIDVDNENKALSVCGVRIDKNYIQPYKGDEYGVDNVSEISIKNRKSILINFCKEKDIVLNKPVDIGNYPTEENILFGKEKENFNNYGKAKQKYFDEQNYPINKNNISFKNMMNESNVSKNNKWKFENKSYMQDTTILKEDKQSKCRRCTIF